MNRKPRKSYDNAATPLFLFSVTGNRGIKRRRKNIINKNYREANKIANEIQREKKFRIS